MVNTPPYSIEDIHNVFQNHVKDIGNSVRHIDEIVSLNYNLENIFSSRFSIIIFLPNNDPSINVGHFVLLSHLDDDTLEYFDSFAQEVPEIIQELAKRNDLKIRINKVKLQNEKSFVCAKYCLLRMQSLPTHLNDFIKILKSNRELTPDQIVDNLIKSLYKK